MLSNNKKIYIAFLIFSICMFAMATINVVNKVNNVPPPAATPPANDVQAAPQEDVVVEYDPYDKDIYWRQISQYSDVILPLNGVNTDDYLASTLFVGDSNTEGIGAFEHLPMKNVLGKHSMDIQGVTSDAYIQIAEDVAETEEDGTIHLLGQQE